MRIGIDGKRALNDPSPEGDRCRNIVRSFVKSYPDIDFYVYVARLKRDHLLKDLEGRHNVRFCLPPPSGFGGELWRKFGITNNLAPDKVDVYFGIDGELPLNIRQSGKKSVLLLSSAMEQTNGGSLQRLRKKLRDFVVGKSCRNATRIVALDEAAGEKAVREFLQPSEKIEMINGPAHGDASTQRLIEILSL